MSKEASVGHSPPAPPPGAHLVLGAAAALQAGEDLGLHTLHPQLPLLCRRGLEVPRLPGEGHHHELERLLGLCGHIQGTHTRQGSPPGAPAWRTVLLGLPAGGGVCGGVVAGAQRATRQPGHCGAWVEKVGTQGLLAAPVRPGTGLEVRGVLPRESGAQCLEKMRRGAGRQCRGMGVCVCGGVGGGCGHHPYMSAAAASFCSSLNPIFLMASAWGSWEPGPSPLPWHRQAGRAGWGAASVSSTDHLGCMSRHGPADVCGHKPWGLNCDTPAVWGRALLQALRPQQTIPMSLTPDAHPRSPPLPRGHTAPDQQMCVVGAAEMRPQALQGSLSWPL